jgi:pimeloyl-ACP methyl ester carboxylesterase
VSNVEQTYRPDARRARSRASTIVFVPGIMGVELVDSRDGRSMWGSFAKPGDDGSQIYEVALPFSDGSSVGDLRDPIVPGDQLLFAEVDLGGLPIHARGYPGVLEGLMKALVEEGAHHHHGRVDPISISDANEHRDPIIGFGYDWRRDIASETERLHATVVAASEERRRRTGNPRIDIIAHSMGTQLVRWYLRYGTAPVPKDGSLPELTWAGVELIERVLLVAPPNSGSAKALLEVLEGSHVNPFLPVYPSAVVATFPAAYELMPRPEDGVVVWSDTGEPVDLYDVQIWETLGWGPFDKRQDDELHRLMPETTSREERLAILRIHVAACLQNARGFHRALDLPAQPPDTIRIHSFVGDSYETQATLRVDRVTGNVEWDQTELGDGTVTRTSALGLRHVNRELTPRLLPHSVHFNGADHLGMVGDATFLNQALYLLLEAPDPPPPEPDR